MTEARILIVDDDEALLQALPEALRLRMPGVTVETFDSALAALESIATVDYDAIVTDIKMPGMDGLALLGEIGELRPDTPTLLITGHGEHDLTVQALRGGAYDFIQKPIERDYFVASLTRAIEKRQLDREIEQQRLALEQHARVLEHVGDGVFLIDGEGIIRIWNPAAEAITGLNADSVLNQPAGAALDGWTKISPRVPVTAMPGDDGESPATIPLEIGDRELWLSMSGVEFADGTVYAFRDLTAERVVDDLKDDFVTTVSHELRTPLAAIYGAAETLRQSDRELPAESRERMLAVIAQESDRLARVVSDVLLASRLDSDRVDVAREPVDLAELAGGVVDTIQAYVREGITIELVVPGELPPIATDRDKLQQVLINLIENAVKYSPDGGRIEVRIEQRDTHVRVSVRDEGLGIPAHERSRIFGKFYRVDPNLTRGIGGTGLGLYVCRELVRRLGGRISLESEEGEGSVFSVDLPLLGARETPKPKSAPSAR